MVSALSGRYLAMGHLGVNQFYPIQYTEFSQDDEGLFYSSPESPMATISSDDEADIQEVSSDDEADIQEVQNTQDTQDFQPI